MTNIWEATLRLEEDLLILLKKQKKNVYNYHQTIVEESHGGPMSVMNQEEVLMVCKPPQAAKCLTSDLVSLIS